MLKRIAVLTALFCVVGLLCLPTGAQNQPEQAPIFTYVAQWAVPRAQWAEVEKMNEGNKALLDELVADGTLIGYGTFDNRIHSVDGMTHGSWFQANSLAGIFNALDKIYARPGAVTQPVQAASKHMDYLMIANFHGAKAVTNGKGYLRVISAQIKPGKEEEFVEAYRHYLLPMYEKLLAEGAIESYQLDTEYNIENAPGRFFSAVVTPNAEGLDKMRVAANELFEKNPAALEALMSASVPNSRNDLIARVSNVTRK
ncbi:MAG TPA: hypothetical protein VLX32_09310 [Candidatus Acidoferrum sp.]|nr:hypothetical protein [Candidatus Acidoferrum sp.]